MKRKAAHQHLVGLRIGSTQLAAAHVVNNGSAEVQQLARTPLERGLVTDGEVRDADALAAALKSFFAERKLPRKDVRLGVASSRIGVRVLDVPVVDDPKQFENAIRFRAQELVPIPVVDAIFDHVVLGEVEGENGEPLRRILLVFAHRDLVERYVEVCRAAGIRLAGIDFDAFALLRAVSPAPQQGQAVVAVAVGHERTILAVSDGTVCSLTRVLEWGSSALDVAIARTLDLAPSQAEPVKHALSLDAAEPPTGLSEIQLEALKNAVRGEIAVLGRELVSSLRFYQSRPESLPIGEVLLAGGGARLAGFAEELQQLLGAPVRLADPLAGVVLGKKVARPDDVASLAIAVGLGIEAHA
ncbi:MAG: type IV pilus assembly protein PilM [Actinobacteria bacterium]|nr:type IV pilus assembly protein PilM [Actinomycetota bacterium]